MFEEPDRYKYRYACIRERFDEVRFATFVEVDVICNELIL
jgi:hypothetical protein